MNTICEECGEQQHPVATFNYHDEQAYTLCAACATRLGFCLGCGWFGRGEASFDNSGVTGYCADCINDVLEG